MIVDLLELLGVLVVDKVELDLEVELVVDLLEVLVVDKEELDLEVELTVDFTLELLDEVVTG